MAAYAIKWSPNEWRPIQLEIGVLSRKNSCNTEEIRERWDDVQWLVLLKRNEACMICESIALYCLIHLVSIAASTPKNVGGIKYLPSIKAWDQPTTNNTIRFSLSCYISLIIWLKSQIVSPWFQSLLFYFFFLIHHI